jgi:CRISPR-associated protein Csm4
MPIFDLTLRGPFYLGEFVGINREATLDWVPSDTLFAAMVTIWVQQGVDVSGRLAKFDQGSLPLLLTSAFPRAGEVRFYPAPPRKPQRLFDVLSPKALKKIAWLSQGVLDQLVRRDSVLEHDAARNFLHGGSIWLTSKERDAIDPLLSLDDEGRLSLWRKQIVPHVTIDRVDNAPNLFHTGRVTFGPGCGLWFGVRGETDWVRAALRSLADEGLGGLRSTGHGAFTFTEVSSDLPLVKGDQWGLCLSRYAPQTETEITQGIQQPQSTYQIVTVGGWCQDDAGHYWRRRSVRMLAEGAILPASARGGLVDVRPLKPEDWLGPQRPVYRSGLAFLIPAGDLAEVV